MLPVIALATMAAGLAADSSDKPTRDYGYETDPPGVAHRHRPLENDLDFEVCRCGFARYMKATWVSGQPFPGWGPWERPALGLVRL